MCKKWWYNLWHKPEPVPTPIPDPIPEPTGPKKTALLFGIGSGYIGSQNDLVGPPYDLKHVKEFIASKYPAFTINVLSDLQVTRSSFENTVKKNIAALNSGDTLLIYYSGRILAPCIQYF